MLRVFYLMSGPAHLPYLTVSLNTLRLHWTGPVHIFAWPESYEIARQIAKDTRLRVDSVQLRVPDYRGKNDQFLDKIRIAQSFRNEDTVLYLDADTSIHGNLGELIRAASVPGFAATQFNDWTTNTRGIRQRMETLYACDSLADQFRPFIKELQENPYPSINGGVWSCRPWSPVLNHWYDWTYRTTTESKIFIADEKMLHLMQPIYFPQGKMVTVCDNGAYNSSPKHRCKLMEPKDVVIYHYHGDSNTRPTKWKDTSIGVELWMPMYQECLRENIGFINDWRDGVRNRHLDALERQTVIPT